MTAGGIDVGSMESVQEPVLEAVDDETAAAAEQAEAADVASPAPDQGDRASDAPVAPTVDGGAEVQPKQ